MDLFQAIIYRFIGSNKTTLYKDLFLPEHPVQAGGKWAIPKRFDITLQESSDTDEDLDRIDKEFVYDLEPTRYPFKIQLDEDLPNRMLEELRPMLGERPISPEIQDTWTNFQAFIQDSIASREDAATTLYTFWIVAMAYFRPFDTANGMKSSFCPSTKDRRGGVDTHISMGSETVIVASALEPNPSNKYAERLVDMASSPEPSIFEGDLPEVLLGHEAALAKLSYTIMDGCGQGPRWAMLYQGNDYIIYLVLPVLAENTRRCTLISSGVLSIDDSRCPFLAVMLFMLLSAHKSHQELCMMLNIKPPLGAPLVSSSAMVDHGGDTSVEPSPVDAQTLVTAQTVYLTTLLDPFTPLPFFRCPSNPHMCKDDRNSLLLRHRVTGNTNIVYQANGFLVKTALPTLEAHLEHEVKVYHHLMRTNAHKVIPTFYGYFFHRYTKVAILSDEGSTLEEFHELSGDMRLNIFNALLEIHRAHVAIKDFNPNNVIISKQGAIICGFTQAIIDHICPGTRECSELAEAQNMLLLDSGSSLLDIGNKSITRKT